MPQTDLRDTQKTPSVSDDPVLQRAVSDLQRMRYFRRQYDQRSAYFYRQYLSQRDRRMYPDNITPRSNSFVPYPFFTVETIVSRIDDAFFGGYDQWFECKGRNSQDDQAAEAQQSVLHNRLHKSKFKFNFETLVRNISIY